MCQLHISLARTAQIYLELHFCVELHTKKALPHIWENIKWPYLREGSSDPLHVWFYGGVFDVGASRIEWRYFWFRQIRDGGWTAILENSNSDISAADHPIYSVFGSRTGFSGSADQMALILV